eukprot:3338303-Amphidinium_carterae.1
MTTTNVVNEMMPMYMNSRMLIVTIMIVVTTQCTCIDVVHANLDADNLRLGDADMVIALTCVHDVALRHGQISS